MTRAAERRRYCSPNASPQLRQKDEPAREQQRTARYVTFVTRPPPAARLRALHSVYKRSRVFPASPPRTSLLFPQVCVPVRVCARTLAAASQKTKGGAKESAVSHNTGHGCERTTLEGPSPCASRTPIVRRYPIIFSFFSFFFSYGSAVDTRLVDSTKLGGTLGERQHWVCSVYTRGYARHRSEGDDQLVRGTCAVCTAVAASGQVKLFGSLHFTRYVGVCLREEERNIRVGRSQSSCRMASVRRTNFTGY